MNSFGHSVRLSIFGESHGALVGVTIDGLPHGIRIDLGKLDQFMARRQGGGKTSTARREPDRCEIVSGLFEDCTTGAPLTILIRNTNTRSTDYSPEIARPSHADYVAFVKYDGFADYRGGGHFSGRLTASLTAAGAIAHQVLEQSGIMVSAKAVQIGTTSNPNAFENTILAAKERGDSVGGIIECTANGLPVGLGEPFFGSCESVISAMLFSIPAVKAVEFGAGMELATMLGSQANDPLVANDDGVVTATNNSGGIQGGITNGMPLVVRACFKPTPSIAIPQRTINLQTQQNITHSIEGRHDPCIALRAVPVVEAAVAFCLLDLLLSA